MVEPSEFQWREASGRGAGHYLYGMQFCACLKIELDACGKGIGYAVASTRVIQTTVDPFELTLGVGPPVPIQT